MVQAYGQTLDPVTLEIYWNRLIAIADLAAATLVRTSFSTQVRESNDYACVLMDANGDTLAENRGSVPSFVGTLSRTLKHFLRLLPRETWRPGDVVITNDPWLGTGHRPDFTMAAPVFHNEELVAFTGSVAHASDVGGVIFSADCRSVFEEGIGVSPMKLFSQGEPNETLLEFIRYNVRVPEQVMGDLFAMVSAGQVSAQRLGELLEEYKLRDLRALSQVIQGRAEEAMRRAVAQVPDGTYFQTVSLDGFDEPLRIACTITVEGDSLGVDFTGTSEQVERGGINVVYNYTWAYTTYPIKCLLDPLTYRNEGSYRPFTITAPEGCILNATYPSPVLSRHLVGHCISSAVFGALAPVLPKRVIADSGATPQFITMFGGVDRSQRPFSLLFFANGGMGAGPQSDGLSCTPFPSNSITGSVEVLESMVPLVMWRKEARQDSGGAGKYRGGQGQDIVFEVTSPQPMELSVMSERWDFPAQGLFGGQPGASTRALKLAPEEQVLPRKGRTTIMPGDVIKFSCAGGGGYGPPEERDIQAVREDLRNGFISEGAARQVYGLAEGVKGERN